MNNLLSLFVLIAFGIVIVLFLITWRWIMDLYQKIEAVATMIKADRAEEATEKLAQYAAYEKLRVLIENQQIAFGLFVDRMAEIYGVSFEEKKSVKKK